MQHNDERPAASGRPSLLSPEQISETGQPRIFGGMAEGGSEGGAKAGSGARRKYSWLAAGVIAVAVIGGASALWFNSEGEKIIVSASTEPMAAAPATAEPLALEPAPVGAADFLPVNPEVDQVSTAAILQDAPPPVAEPNKPAADEFTTLLEDSGAATSRKPIVASVVAKEQALAPVAVTAVAKPLAKKPVAVKAASARSSAKPAPKAGAPKALALAPAKKKNDVTLKASQSLDSDVTLLAALVAHSKAIQPKKTSSAAEKLRHCKMLSTAVESEQCRASVCATVAKHETECKRPRLAKAAPSL